MISFNEWMYERMDEAKKKPRPVPTAHKDIDRWLRSIELLKRDLEDLQSAKKIAAQRLARIVKIDKKKPPVDEKPKDTKKPNEIEAKKPEEKEKPKEIKKSEVKKKKTKVFKKKKNNKTDNKTK